MERIKSQEIYQGRVFTLRKDTIRTESGKEMQREVVDHAGAVVILAVDGEELVFVRQYRHAAGKNMLELVAGTLEPGEDPADTAERELQEEAGYKPGKLNRVGSFYSAPGFCTELLHLFVAEDLTPSQLPPDEDEEITVERIPVDKAVQMALDGEFQDAKTLVGVLWYAQRGAAR